MKMNQSRTWKCSGNLLLTRDPEFRMVYQLVLEELEILIILRTWLNLSLKHSYYLFKFEL